MEMCGWSDSEPFKDSEEEAQELIQQWQEDLNETNLMDPLELRAELKIAKGEIKHLKYMLEKMKTKKAVAEILL